MKAKDTLIRLAEKAGITEWSNSQLIKGKDGFYFLDLVDEGSNRSKRINVCESNSKNEIDKSAEIYEEALVSLKVGWD